MIFHEDGEFWGNLPRKGFGIVFLEFLKIGILSPTIFSEQVRDGKQEERGGKMTLFKVLFLTCLHCQGQAGCCSYYYIFSAVKRVGM